MQMIELLVCILPLLLMVSLFILSERHKISSLRKRARDAAALAAEQKVINGKASDDATPPYFT